MKSRTKHAFCGNLNGRNRRPPTEPHPTMYCELRAPCTWTRASRPSAEFSAGSRQDTGMGIVELSNAQGAHTSACVGNLRLTYVYRVRQRTIVQEFFEALRLLQ